MIFKSFSIVILLISIACFGCDDDSERLNENSKRLNASFKTDKLPSYESVYHKIVLRKTDYPSQVSIADSLFEATEKTNKLIDSLVSLIEKTDPVGKRVDLGATLLVNTSAGVRLREGSNLVYQLSLQGLMDKSKQKSVEDRFLKYKGYLATPKFNEIYFSKSSSIFILAVLRGLKADITKAAFTTFNDIELNTNNNRNI